MNEFYLGTYQLGYRYVVVTLKLDDYGGSFSLNTADTKRSPHASMTIGVAARSTSEAMEVAAHEAFEAATQETCCRFKQSSGYTEGASDTYWFVMNHNQMTEVMARVGNFIWQIGEDLDIAIKLLKEQGA